MATYHAISAIGLSVLALLEDNAKDTDFEGLPFELYQASNFKNPMEEGISLYLYRTGVSTARRHLPGRALPDGSRQRPPLPLDLHYLLIPWGKKPEKQHLLLGWSMRILEDTPILPPNLLNHHSPHPETFRSDETVEIVGEALSVQDLSYIWDVAKPNVQIAAGYVARVVAIETTLKEPKQALSQVQVLGGKGG